MPVLQSSTEDAGPRLNRRQQAKVRTRAKVLEAARVLFSERGYDAATIRDIAKGAGMSTGAVFANFQDKAELFEAVIADLLGAMLTNFRQGTGTDGRVADRLAGAFEAGYRDALESLPMMQAIIARSWFQPEADDQRQRELIRPLIEVMVNVLTDAVRGGELRQDIELRVFARMLWDIYICNFRYAAYDSWTMDELRPHIRKQIDLVLSSQLSRQ